MLQSVISNNKWMLQDDGLILLSHTAEQPFVTTLKREKVYEVNRGTVKEQVVERDQIPLTTLEQTAEGLCLSAEGHRLEIKLVPHPLGMELRLTGEPGWAYRFSLPAEPEEAVFGGGEQYRQVNLRGEEVVNLVSEHIKAAAKALPGKPQRPDWQLRPHAGLRDGPGTDDPL